MCLTTTAVTVWEPAPSLLRLGAGEVHVWRARLDVGAGRVRDLRDLLSPDELERAARFRFERDRCHFVAARGLLRCILGLYLRVSPARVGFTYSAYGKPLLKEDERRWLRFNLSHSRGLALFAFAHGREVGVDIEYVRDELAEGEIAERFFAPREVAALRALPVALQPRAFFDCWARKEAYVKARGEGLSHPLDRFEVALAPHEPAVFLNDSTGGLEVARWSMREISTAPGYAAAVVFEAGATNLRCWRWSDAEAFV
ncbi:MAG TPA: 4'-phosphopantetheinyl transferase superfamily protein [Pyrinomonadaceae bacterium]